eukprot:9235757-Pyramimonas_sp.AAC.1
MKRKLVSGTGKSCGAGPLSPTSPPLLRSRASVPARPARGPRRRPACSGMAEVLLGAAPVSPGRASRLSALLVREAVGSWQSATAVVFCWARPSDRRVP